MIKKKKSYAKGMGLKSTMVSDSKVYMTSFADGSKAKLEKMVENNNIICLSEEKEAFSAEMAEKENGFKIGNEKFGHPKGYDVIAQNPLFTGTVKEDMLGLKGTLEKRYFGDSVSGNDNVSVQIIHNILDIEKILAEYIINAAYAVDNIAGKDIIGDGKFSPVNTYDEFVDPDGHTEHYKKNFTKYEKEISKIKEQYESFENFLNNHRLRYFGKAFFVKQGEDVFIKKDNKKCYHILALLSGLRHWVVHNNEDKSRIDRKWLYNLDKYLDKEFITTLNYMYNDMADGLTESFSNSKEKTNSAANINYIAKTLDIGPEKIAEQYFRFIIMKEQKNMGFNITKLRESMLDRRELSDIRDNHRVFDSIRSKLYTMMDFIIYRYYIENEKNVKTKNEKLEEDKQRLSDKDLFVINLRGSFNEDQKDRLYYDEAERLWSILGDYMLNIKRFKGSRTNYYKDKGAPKLERLLPEGKKITTFSKLMYMLTMFLDGKEINDLLTTLINKFDNIQGLLAIMPSININAKFSEEYAFFNESGKVAEELRIIKSIARMGDPVANTKRAMMIDAIKILGTELTDDELIKLADQFSKSSDGKMIPKGKHGMRNFIISNVINSKRFHYLIRYGDPSHLHEIAKNEDVVRFALGRIADLQKKQGEKGKNQIDRYYEICIGKNSDKTIDEKLNALTKIIVEMKYDLFEDNRRVIENTGADNAEREKFKKIISLYLTVIYHILKNIVNINSRYVIGFHCVERDRQLYRDKYPGEKIDEPLISLTKFCLGVPERDSNVEAKMKEKAQASLKELETVNPELYAIYDQYSEEEKKEEFRRQINREKAKTARNAYLRNTKWNERIRNNLNDLEDSESWICKLFRNKAAHLEVAIDAYMYINDIAEVKSYFQIYHFIMQKIIINEIVNDPKAKYKGKVKDYFEYVNDNNLYNDRLLKLMCIPFGYCITRYKNLSIEALFDKNEADKYDEEKKKEARKKDA